MNHIKFLLEHSTKLITIGIALFSAFVILNNLSLIILSGVVVFIAFYYKRLLKILNVLMSWINPIKM